MKTDFSINVQVNLGVTPELAQLVSAILTHKPTIVQTVEEALETKPEVEEKPEETTTAASQPPTNRGRKKKEEAATDKSETTKEPAEDEQQEANANQADANGEQEAEQQPNDEAQGQTKAQEPAKPLTAEDVRAVMHRTRQRIEGEDYKEHTDSDLYKKYHKPLTAQFKNIAALLGADKPSALPSDKIADFIAQCDELKILQDGTIGTECPY